MEIYRFGLPERFFQDLRSSNRTFGGASRPDDGAATPTTLAIGYAAIRALH